MKFLMLKMFQLTTLLILVGVIITKCSILQPVEDKLWKGLFDVTIGRWLDEFEEERQKAIENHECFPGRDTAFIWMKHYEIWRHLGEYRFRIETEDASDDILRYVKEYDTRKNKFYVIAEEGYAVVDKENYCRVFITLPQDIFERGYVEDDDGNRTHTSTKVESKYIEYLSEFDEFSEEEKKVFRKMEN